MRGVRGGRRREMNIIGLVRNWFSFFNGCTLLQYSPLCAITMVTQHVLSADTLSSASGGCWFLAGTKVSPVTNTLCTLDTLVRSCVHVGGRGRGERGKERGEGEGGREGEGKGREGR